MSVVVQVEDLHKVYDGGFEALKGVTLDIEQGEIIALLGPNGAGKTTLISAICGLISPTSGSVRVSGFDTQTEFREARKLIGLVPQEVALEPFETVKNTVSFSRGLFGLPRNRQAVEEILKMLSLFDKKDSQVKELSGGMKRRVLIAKALAHEPRVLFLDEPTAGVDVELRKDMWEIVADLKANGVTIILTTHYIEEAEAIADRIGVINNGELLLVEEKARLMAQMGKKQLDVQISEPIKAVPQGLTSYDLQLSADGETLIYTYDTRGERTGITQLLGDVAKAGLQLRDVVTRQSTLEEIFVTLVQQDEGAT